MLGLKQYITEKRINGITCKYLENPSVDEAFYFWKSSKSRQLRLWDIDGILYVWEDPHVLHHDFGKKEIPNYSDYAYQTIKMETNSYKGNIDPLGVSEGTRFGYKFFSNRKKFIKSLLDKIEEDINGKFTFIKYNSFTHQDIYSFKLYASK